MRKSSDNNEGIGISDTNRNRTKRKDPGKPDKGRGDVPRDGYGLLVGQDAGGFG